MILESSTALILGLFLPCSLFCVLPVTLAHPHFNNWIVCGAGDRLGFTSRSQAKSACAKKCGLHNGQRIAAKLFPGKQPTGKKTANYAISQTSATSMNVNAPRAANRVKQRYPQIIHVLRQYGNRCVRTHSLCKGEHESTALKILYASTVKLQLIVTFPSRGHLSAIETCSGHRHPAFQFWISVRDDASG